MEEKVRQAIVELLEFYNGDGWCDFCADYFMEGMSHPDDECPIQQLRIFLSEHGRVTQLEE